MSDIKRVIEINGIKFYHENYVMKLQSSLTTVAQAMQMYITDNDDDMTTIANRIKNLEEFTDDMKYLYERLEYIESQPMPNNLQYLNTKVKPNQNTRLVLDAELMDKTGTKGYRMAGTQVGSTAKYRIGTFQGTEWLFRYDGQSDYRKAPADASELINRNTVEIGNGKLIINGEVRHDFGALEFQATYPILLFAINDTELVDNAHMRLYGCQIYQGDELIRDYVPAYHKAAKVIGMYDRVEGRLYENQGTGEFKMGPYTKERF